MKTDRLRSSGARAGNGIAKGKLVHKKQFSAALGVVVMICALFALNTGGAIAATCVPATNIEAIIDDSVSMSWTDSNINRAEALKILISKSGNAKKTLGAVEFGSGDSTPAATTVFAPAAIGANATTMSAALTTNLLADHGATDYNAAFTQAGVDNPGANARIFLTDGAHNKGDYANGHQGGPPTYVIGLGIGDSVTGGTDAARLQQIANETGGTYYPNVTTDNVNATMNKIDAALNCQAIAATFTDIFSAVGQSKSRATRISARTRSIDLVLSWTSPLDAFTIGSIKLRTSRGTIASISRKHLKIKRSAGKTFLNVHVSGLKRGKLRFKLRATTLGSATGSGVTLTTQATQNRRR